MKSKILMLISISSLIPLLLSKEQKNTPETTPKTKNRVKKEKKPLIIAKIFAKKKKETLTRTKENNIFIRKKEKIQQKNLEKSLSLIFQKNMTWPLSAEKKEELKKLNSYGSTLTHMLLKALSSLEISNADILFRMASVDYLNYRMKWDLELRDLLTKHINYARIKTLQAREKAVFIAEYSELLGGLASIDWGLAANSIEKYPEGSLLKKISCDRAFHSLLTKKGQSLARARLHVEEAGCPKTSTSKKT